MHCHSRTGKRHRPRHSDTTHGHVGLHNELAELVCNARTPTAADPLRSWGDQPAKHRWHAAPPRPTALDSIAVQGRAAGCGRRRASPPASSGSSARVHAAGTSQERDRRGRWMVFSSRTRPTDNRTRCRYRVKGEADAEFLHGGEEGSAFGAFGDARHVGPGRAARGEGGAGEAAGSGGAGIAWPSTGSATDLGELVGAAAHPERVERRRRSRTSDRRGRIKAHPARCVHHASRSAGPARPARPSRRGRVDARDRPCLHRPMPRPSLTCRRCVDLVRVAAALCRATGH